MKCISPYRIRLVVFSTTNHSTISNLSLESFCNPLLRMVKTVAMIERESGLLHAIWGNASNGAQSGCLYPLPR